MVTKGPPLVSTGKMKIYDLEELERTANAALKAAMSNERSKRWNKVIHTYKLLTRLLNKNNFPKEMSVPSNHSMLMYETYYHLGTALQHVGAHKQAVDQYTKAIDSVFIPKNGCLAGCNSNSCLMTPLYARRAFAHAKSGDWKNALKDAEKAVVLDSKNPDVYCVRALVRSTRGEQSLAIQDVKTALKYNPNHLCALIIKGCLDAPLEEDEWLEPSKTVENSEHKKACSINPDCHNFLDVQDFNHDKIVAFYERFLYSLSIPHTISEIAFIPRSHWSRESSAKSTDRRTSATSNRSVVHRVQGPCTQLGTICHSKCTLQSSDQQPGMKPFRCGTPSGMSKEHEMMAAQRRKHYAEAIREHMSRPKTPDDAMAYRERQHLNMEIASYKASKLTTIRDNTTSHLNTGHNIGKKITVFNEVNVKDAPRMYYRPWLGDKLPVPDVERKQCINPPFRV